MATTTVLSLSTLPSRVTYSPLVPSPLNPDVDLVVPPRHHKLREKRRQQSRGDVSPTQRLLRHKAAMAWKSEALTRESRIYTREEILSIIADCDSQDAAARTPIIMPDLPEKRKKQQQPRVHIRAAHWKEMDGEEDDFFCELDDLLDTDTSDETPRQWPTLVPKLRSPFSKDTARRVALAIGLMCICGCLPVLRAHGFHIYQASEAP